MNQRERMLSGLPYKAWLDGLEEDRQACKQKIYDLISYRHPDRVRKRLR